MASKRKSLKSPRKLAFDRQSGHCFYCGQLMWLYDLRGFAKDTGLSIRQAKGLRCTGEHLVPHAEGGAASESNIVAACRYCNSHRHRTAIVLAPVNYKKRVKQRLAKGKWHQISLVEACRHATDMNLPMTGRS